MPVARFPEMPAAEKPVKSEASIVAAWQTALLVARPRNDLMHAVQSANSTPATTWDAAFKVHMPVARFPEMPAAEKPDASIVAAWEMAFGVARPRNDLMHAVQSANSTPTPTWDAAFKVARPRNDLLHAVQSANSTPTTTWDAAFKVHMPVACFPAMPA
jgi:hypothetical protein